MTFFRPLPKGRKFFTEKVTDTYTAELQRQVEVLKDEDWRDRYMTLEMKMEEKYDAGYDVGIRTGIKTGIETGIKNEEVKKSHLRI